MKRQPFAASQSQREKVNGEPCVVCGRSFCDPMHIIDRSITTVGQDNALAVVAGCRQCHGEYDGGTLDLLPHMEPRYRQELAYAVERVGLVATLRRVTNERNAGARAA